MSDLLVVVLASLTMSILNAVVAKGDLVFGHALRQDVIGVSAKAGGIEHRVMLDWRKEALFWIERCLPLSANGAIMGLTCFEC